MGVHEMPHAASIRIKRIYEEPDGGYRVLVDRVWPRGVSRTAADLSQWCKEVAPSDELRKWFGHRAEKFEEFADRYHHELTESGAALKLRDEARSRADTVLLYGAADTEHNQAVVLRNYLLGRSR